MESTRIDHQAERRQGRMGTKPIALIALLTVPLMTLGWACSTMEEACVGQDRDMRRRLPPLAQPSSSRTLKVVRFTDPGPPSHDERGRRTSPLVIEPTSPLPSDASIAEGLDLSKAQTVLVVTPEVLPPEAGLSLADYNQYAASVERGFMDAGCRVVDRRRLEQLRQEWQLKQESGEKLSEQDTISLGKLLNAQLIVFAEHLSSFDEEIKVRYRVPKKTDTDWTPKAIWVEQRLADYRPSLAFERAGNQSQIGLRGIQDSPVFLDPDRGCTWAWSQLLEQNWNRRYCSACRRSHHEGLGYRINESMEHAILATWEEAVPQSLVIPVLKAPRTRAGACGLETADLGEVERYGSRNSLDVAIIHDGTAVVVSREHFDFFRSRVHDEARSASGFAPLPQVDSEGRLEYEPVGTEAVVETRTDNVSVSTVSLTCKIVVVESSQIAWIGTSRLSYTDILEDPMVIDINDDGPNFNAWPRASRQKSEILSKIFHHTATQFLDRLRTRPRPSSDEELAD